MAKKSNPLRKVGYKDTKGEKAILEGLQEEWPTRLEFTSLERVLTGIALLILVVTVMWTVVSYRSLPAEIPTHYDIHGQVDGFGGKGNIWILLVADVACVLGLMLSSIFTRTYNIPVMFLQKRTLEEILRATRLLVCVVNIGTAGLFLYLLAAIVLAWQPSLWIFAILLGIIVLPMAPYFLYLSKSN